MQDLYTPTYILTWNPKKFDWKDYHIACDFVKRNEPFSFDWSCRSNSPKENECFILLMQGMSEKNGIVGTGIFTSRPYTVRETPYGEQFVDIRLMKMWDYTKDSYIHTSQLQEMFDKQCWTPQMSGTRIKSSILPDLWERIRHEGS